VPIKAIAMDIDGVLTDGTVWIDEDGRETKRISFRDVMGVSIGRRAGLQYVLVSGEAGRSVDVVAAKFGIGEVYRGCRDKAGAMRDFASRHGLVLAEICFIGDDVNDLEAMETCGLSAAPADAVAAVRDAADVVTTQPGGNGSVREVIDGLLRSVAGDA
jgi:3-deoxy-D-manno-octulosonate 8-phosphate phosphatase (KDO 8-P phosphatase)